MSALAVATGPDDRELDDLDLVAAVRAGDDRAFEILFLRYQARVAAYVAGMVRDHGRAEDITQEVFMSALRRLRTDDEREILFRPWIYEIAKNKCIDAYRRGRNATEVSFDAHDQIGAAEHDRLAAPGATPDAAVEGKLAFDNLRGAFGGLSREHHEILVMREFEGLSYREIGERLGMSRASVESTLFRARKRLGEEYEELVSGKRCLRVQRIVDDSGGRTAGLRDQRRVARHLAHCQPCRRYAHLAGADLGLTRPSVPARVAAFLPLPAFLRRRWSGEDAAQILSQQAARPAAQWSAHLAGTLDPGAVSSWAKLAATAATVALAGVGGSALEHHSTAESSRAAADAAARSASARDAAPGLALPGSAQERAARSGNGATAAAGGASSTAGAAAGGGPLAATGKDSRRGATASDPQRPLGAGAGSPLAPVDASKDRAVAPVIDSVGQSTRALDRPGGAGGDTAAGGLSDPGALVRPIAPPAVGGVTGSAGGVAGGDTLQGNSPTRPVEDAVAPVPKPPVQGAPPVSAPKPTAVAPDLGG